MNLKDLFQLAGENGKLVFVDEDGGVRGVFLAYQDYQKLLNQTSTQTAPAEQVNKQIIQAQLEQDLEMHNHNLETITEPEVILPEQVSSILLRRREELFGTSPFGRVEAPRVDLREEVIDPNFGKEESEESDTEEIKPRFDDI